MSTELTFDSTTDRACVTIVIIDDDLLESTEEFQLLLRTDDDSVILDPVAAVVSISDTDGMANDLSITIDTYQSSFKQLHVLDSRRRLTVVLRLKR